MAASWAAWHPNLVDFARRQEAIADGDAIERGGHRLAVRLSIVCLALAVAGGVTAMLVPSVSVAAGMLTAVALAASLFCARVWLHDPQLDAVPSQHFAVDPFTADENRRLIQAQAPEPFRAVSACPGCGNSAAHSMRRPGKSEPSWADVVRQCAVCQREWAQG
jgi:hypothetical protein